MPRKVAIVSTYQTVYEAEKAGQTLEEMIFFSVKSLLENSGISIKDIESIVTASSDQIDGRAISMMLTSAPAGAELKDLINTSSASEHALILAYMRILSGVYDTSLVVSWAKSSEIELPQIENLCCEPFYERDIGMTLPIGDALQISRYADRYKPTEEAVAEVVKKNRGNALNNPYAHLKKKVSTEEVLESEVLFWPLRKLHLPPLSDGVCAIVLASEEKARSFGDRQAWIKGVGWAADNYWMGDRDLSRLDSLSIAGTQAYNMAGIKSPKEIDVAELHDTSAYHELMEYEALGFCGPGEGAAFVQKGITSMSGSLPVNPSGGVLSSNPVFASGLVRVIEASLQVMGEAGDRQVGGAKTALAHATSGFAGQISSVFIIGKD